MRVGDKVRIKDNAREKCAFGCNAKMVPYVGKSTTIKCISNSIFFNCKKIKLDIDNGVWNWSENVLELVKKADENIDVEIVEDNEEEPLNDSVNHPSHYTDGNIEVMDYIEDKQLNFARGNVIKYVSRAGKKDPNKELEDLKKASWYLNREIERLNKEAE